MLDGAQPKLSSSGPVSRAFQRQVALMSLPRQPSQPTLLLYSAEGPTSVAQGELVGQNAMREGSDG